MGDAENAFALFVEACSIVFSLCVSIALGLLVAPWLGFLAFAAFVLVAVAVVSVSYFRDKRDGSSEEWTS